MSATEELRRLLDERGVEWYEPIAKPNKTWFPDSNGTNCCARPWSDKLEIRRIALTPEQAIAATLGGDDKTSWHELFGTPERAARTMVDMCEGGTFDDCGGCPAALAECKLGDYDALLEWLRGDAE